MERMQPWRVFLVLGGIVARLEEPLWHVTARCLSGTCHTGDNTSHLNTGRHYGCQLESITQSAFRSMMTIARH